MRPGYINGHLPLYLSKVLYRCIIERLRFSAPGQLPDGVKGSAELVGGELGFDAADHAVQHTVGDVDPGGGFEGLFGVLLEGLFEIRVAFDLPENFFDLCFDVHIFLLMLISFDQRLRGPSVQPLRFFEG